MINQLLDDPKLTATKYREWKVMNTMLIQDIYQQRQVSSSAPETSPQGLERPPSSTCVENSMWEQTRIFFLLLSHPKQLFEMLEELDLLR